MLNGDLSNKAAPRIYIVFDGLVSSVSPEDKDEFLNLVEEGKYREAVFMMIPDISIWNRIGYLSRNKNVNIYIVTWMNQGMAEAIEEHMNDLMVPVRGCISTTPGYLARLTAQDETVAGIYDPDPDHVLTYGSKGRIVKSERDLS